MAVSKKNIIVYQQTSPVFRRTINGQDVEYVNVMIRKKYKEKYVVMKLEKFNNLGYEREDAPKVIVSKKDENGRMKITRERQPQTIGVRVRKGEGDGNELVRVSIEDGTKLTIYEKISEYHKNDVPYVNLKVYQISDVPNVVRFKSMKLDDFEKLVEINDDDDDEDEKDIKILKITEKNTMNNQIIKRSYVMNGYPLTLATAEYIATWLFNFRNKLVKEAREKCPGGFTLRHKVVYASSSGEHASSIYSAVDPLEVFMFKTMVIARKNFKAMLYILRLTYMEVIVAKLPVEGGCSTKNSNVEKIKYKFDKILLRNPKSTNNNCLFAVFNLIAGLKGNEVKPDIVRKKLGIPIGTLIHIDQVPTIADYYKKNYILVNEKFETLNQKIYNNNEETSYIYLRNNHYSLMEIINYKNCKMCGAYVNIAKHKKCSASSVSYKQRILLKKKNIVKVKKITDDTKIDYNQVIHLDIETFQEKFRHVPYSCGWYNNTYKSSYGKNCFDEFIDDMINEKDKIVNAYNGSGFDFYFLIDKLEDRGIHVENIILSNGKAIYFKFGNNIKVFDLYLFMSNKSLSNACEDFNIKNAKTFFDHKLIKSWEDTDKYKEEVKKYNKQDVEALKEIFETMNDIMYERFKINICKYITLPQLAWELWTSKLKVVIEIVNDMEQYKFITAAKYGGRCYPMKKNFKSKLYNDVVLGKITYNQLLESGDYLFPVDCNGLYSAAMAGNDLMKVEYPIEFCRWSDKPEEEWKNSKIGIYKIKYFPPKNIRVVPLPYRQENNNISWDLLDGEGIYTSVDIQNAIDCGYRVEFQGKCLVWDKSANIFKDFVDEFANIKSEAEKSGNSSLRAVAKDTNNSLYGKTMQKAIFRKHKIIHNIFEFNDFVREYGNNFDWQYLNDNRMIVSGEVNDAVKEKYISKPCYLGCFITAYSRRLMLLFMKAIDPTLQTRIFEYTDTDSLHLSASAYFKLRKLGYIVDKKDSKMGYLCSDIPNDGLIISATYLGPKCYSYHYINNKGIVATKDEDEIIRCNDCLEKDSLCKKCAETCSVKKCKGIPKKHLRNHLYDFESSEEISFTGLKKKNMIITDEDIKKGIKPFDIVENKLTRTFQKHPWNGMILFDEEEWYPIGYKF